MRGESEMAKAGTGEETTRRYRSEDVKEGGKRDVEKVVVKTSG